MSLFKYRNMFALIFEDKVAQIADQKFPVAKPLKWVKCDKNIKVGWFYIKKKFKQSLKSDQELLSELKQRKIAEIKLIRDQNNIEPITDCKAFLLDKNGNKTSKRSYFVFYTNRHLTNPASDPESIISQAINLEKVSYFTKDTNGKKITVELTSSVARSLRRRIADRNGGNYKLYSEVEAKIKDAQTIDEVKAIAVKF